MIKGIISMQNHLSASTIEPVTPSDTDVVEGNPRALYIGGEGNVTITAHLTADPVTFVGVPAGFILPVNVYKVMATGTTATNIVALK